MEGIRKEPSAPILLTKQTSWYGAYSGYYEQLPRFIAQQEPSTRVVQPEPGLANRLRGKLYAMRRGWSGGRNQTVSAAEQQFRALMRDRPQAAAHLLAAEEHLWFLDEWQRAPKNLVATIHFPQTWWNVERATYLRRLSSAIILYRADIPFFEEIIGAGRVAFVHHGVHTDFFAPRPLSASGKIKIVFCGQFLRNTQMFARVARRLAQAHPEIEFHIVVAPHGLKEPGIASIKDEPWVRLRLGISDEELRDLLASAYLLLIPFDHTGANNAVVEALSSGLPIVTTDVGGISDYGGGELFPVVGNNDDDAMIQLVERYLANRNWRNEIGAACRQFAEENLTWAVVARKHLEAYALLAETQPRSMSGVNS